MSTELAVRGAGDFLALSPEMTEEMIEAREAREMAGEEITPSDLIRIKVPSGGSTTWMIPKLDGEEAAKTIDGVLCYWQKRGVLWPTEDPQEGAQPVLVTDDLITAEQVGPIPDDMVEEIEKCRLEDGRIDWRRLSYNQFGSRKNGSGKRCEEQRLLYILTRDSMMPYVVKAPPGSLSNVKKFFAQLCTQMAFYYAVISLGLEKATSRNGDVYAKIVPKLIGKLDRETARQVKVRYTDMLAGISKHVDVE